MPQTWRLVLAVLLLLVLVRQAGEGRLACPATTGGQAIPRRLELPRPASPGAGARPRTRLVRDGQGRRLMPYPSSKDEPNLGEWRHAGTRSRFSSWQSRQRPRGKYREDDPAQPPCKDRQKQDAQEQHCSDTLKQVAGLAGNYAPARRTWTRRNVHSSSAECPCQRNRLNSLSRKGDLEPETAGTFEACGNWISVDSEAATRNTGGTCGSRGGSPSVVAASEKTAEAS
eukprot:2021023-Rhodomonas_salina.1